MSDHDYAGDRTPQQTWDILEKEPRAVLVDCRTEAEWAFVGFPVLDAIDKQPLFVEWLSYPAMKPNPVFVDAVSAEVPEKDAPILFLCRSGQRSQAAAAALTKAGYTACYNILEGFEGDKDASGCRGTLGGWKMRGLPWKQK
ncbi:MAG: rhodanese-like domain-containing protein [Rhodospirillales bacterium]